MTDDLVKLIAVCEKAAQEPENMVLLDPAAVLPIAQGAASALESLSAENAALKAGIERHASEFDVLDSSHRDLAKRLAVAGEQRNEAFERAAKVADGFADRSIHHYHAMKIAAAIRNLSKES